MLLLVGLASAFTFPVISELNLLDERIKLPADIKDRAVVLFSYSEAQQSLMDGWSGQLLRAKVQYFEIPLMGEVGPMIAAGMTVGMRAGRDRDREAVTIPIFSEPPQWKQTFGTDGEHLEVFVVSTSGSVKLHLQDGWEADKLKTVLAAVK